MQVMGTRFLIKVFIKNFYDTMNGGEKDYCDIKTEGIQHESHRRVQEPKRHKGNTRIKTNHFRRCDYAQKTGEWGMGARCGG